PTALSPRPRRTPASSGARSSPALLVAMRARDPRTPSVTPARGRILVSMSGTSPDESRAGVSLTNLDQPLFDGAGATKRDLVEYLDAVHDRIIPALEDRPLSVVRVHRGQEAFMQKNVPN